MSIIRAVDYWMVVVLMLLGLLAVVDELLIRRSWPTYRGWETQGVVDGNKAGGNILAKGCWCNCVQLASWKKGV